VGIKIFKNFISESVLNAEREAFSELGLGLAEMSNLVLSVNQRVACKDAHQLQMRFRQLCYPALQKMFSADDLKKLKQPVRRLKKFHAPIGKETKLDISVSDDQAFSVATVLYMMHCLLCQISHTCHSFAQFNVLFPGLDLNDYGKMHESKLDASGIPEQYLTKGPLSRQKRQLPALAERGFRSDSAPIYVHLCACVNV
jgi:hypothetical protein